MAKRYLYSFLLTLLLLVFSLYTFAQFSGVKWNVKIFDSVPVPGDYPGYPEVTNVIPANNNAAFVIGQLQVEIIAGPVFVAKVSSDGKVIWFQKIGFGGWHERFLSKAKVTNDGGLVIVSITHDGMPTDSGYSDQADYSNAVIYKISGEGDLEWHKFLGGGRVDIATNLEVDRRGDILITGYTFSAFDDFEDKRRFVDSAAYFDDSSRVNYYTNYDAFIAKLSPTGQFKNIKCYGGSSFDELHYIIDHPSYGYVSVGYSGSKDYDLPSQGTKGGLWMIRLDTSLNIIKTNIVDSLSIAGKRFFQKDNKMYLSDSLNLQELGFDGAIVKALNSKGIRFNEDCYFDRSGNVYKPLTDRKTIDIYDSLLNKIKSIKIAGWDHDFFQIHGVNRNQLFLTGKAKFIEIYVEASSSMGYEVQSNLVTSFSEQYNLVNGLIFYDSNSNNILDNGEQIVNGLKIVATKNNDTIGVVSNADGFYSLPLDSGQYRIQLNSTLPYYSIIPSSIQVEFPAFDKTDSINFALQPIPNKKDLSINLLPLNIGRPGFPVQYQLICTNQGTEGISNVQVKFLKNPRVNFVSSSPVVNTTVGDTLIWNIASMKPFDTSYIHLDLRIAAPPTVNNTDTLLFKSFVYPLTGDETPEDNQFKLVQQVQGSYDPNDKTETHGGIITPEQLAGNDYLTYLIRFQNTGTDTAFNVMIRDTLTNKLDWSSFEMVSSSHPYQLYMIKPYILEFSFPNILLVDSNKNEPASHGFIAYRIKPKQNLSIGDTVLNRAHIYFDYNLPVITNDEFTVLRNTLVTSVVDLNAATNQLLLYPNPSNGKVTISRNGRLSGKTNLQITDMNGRVVHQSNFGQIATEHFNQSIDISNLSKGFYIVSLRVGKDAYYCKFIIQ